MISDKEVRTLKEKYATAKAALVKVTGESVAAMTRALFDGYPAMQSFSWTQYTPNWNDGEECSFHVHSDSDQLLINDVRGYKNEDPLLWAAYSDVGDLLEKLGSEMLKDLFGDHAQITFKADGTATVEVYDHE